MVAADNAAAAFNKKFYIFAKRDPSADPLVDPLAAKTDFIGFGSNQTESDSETYSRITDRKIFSFSMNRNANASD